MSAYAYPLALAVISAVVMVLEWRFPWRRNQRQLRPGLVSDAAHLVFNGHFLGLIVFGIAAEYIVPPLRAALPSSLDAFLHAGVAGAWPWWIQVPVILFGLDFLQWAVHVALHRVPGLWSFHQTHHSVVDGEMDWIVSFRFQWTEVVIYKTATYLPLAFFGFGWTAVMVHAVFGTLVGHLNHANFDTGRGPWSYLLNTSRMHLWHHDAARGGRDTVNFGIIFSCWDWIFGTAYLPAHGPERLGFDGVETHPRDFLGQTAHPLGRWLGPGRGARLAAAIVGLVLILLGWQLSAP